MTPEKTPVEYGVFVKAEDVDSELVVVIALLEEIKKYHPKAYPIAVEALRQLNGDRM